MAEGKSIFIFGASRGIGLGLARTLSERGWQVTASERSHGDELHKLEGVTVVTADVTEPASYEGLGFGEGSFDVVLVNAGIPGPSHQSADKASDAEVSEIMLTNAFGPARAGRALLPTIKDGGTLAFMSSLLGSIADNSGGHELYRASKAAQNMLAKGISEQSAKARDVEVLSLHPGWVQTAMGGPDAPLTVQESVDGLAEVLSTSGGGGYRFVGHRGETIPF